MAGQGPGGLYVMFNGLNDDCRASHPGLRSGLLVIARQLAGGGVVMQEQRGRIRLNTSETRHQAGVGTSVTRYLIDLA